MGDEAGYEYEISRSVSHDLVGDADVTGLGVPGRGGRLRQRTLLGEFWRISERLENNFERLESPVPGAR